MGKLYGNDFSQTTISRFEALNLRLEFKKYKTNIKIISLLLSIKIVTI